MPWKHGIQVLKPGKAWTDSENRMHPKTWMRYSDASKKRYGIVWEDNPVTQPFDSRFYHGRQLDGTLIPKSLTDVNEVDDDGNPVNDIHGNQIVTPGLKTTWVAQTKRTANEKLAVHDWMVTRKTEKSTAIPSSVTTYRDAVRTKCAAIETALNGAADLAAFMALFEDTVDSDGNVTAVAKINDWPDEI
mgnify:CR=1 FL=1|jgi:hypothetical protein|tara:strand:+ start:244 stop:810 length:567 start_codon:yes stop_codon:yes gene_type:complete